MLLKSEYSYIFIYKYAHPTLVVDPVPVYLSQQKNRLKAKNSDQPESYKYVNSPVRKMIGNGVQEKSLLL
jgi:hypothetical protein